jgi:sarcosine oxidase subunit gamma
MLNYKTTIKENKSYSDLEMKEIKPIMKLIIRGKTKDFITAIGKNLNMILPIEANTSTSGEALTALWLSPDEWMLISNKTISEDTNTYEVEDNLINNISKTKLV